MRGHDATERPVASVEEKTHARRHSLRITSPAQSPTQAPTAPKWWAWRSRPVPETNVPGDAAFAGRGTPRIALCTPITSGDGEGTWEVRRRPRARAAGERCAGGGEKGRPAELSVRYVKRESLANHVILQIFALPTRRSSARAWVATPPCPSSPLLRLPTSATGWRE